MKRRIQFSSIALLLAAPAWGAPHLNTEGDVGHINLPSAYVPENGETSFSYFYSEFYSGQRLQFQASDRLALGVAYSDSEFHGSEEGVDLKFQILQEGEYTPAIALGFRDFLGIGSRASEYVVASKSFGPIEASIGANWGAVSGAFASSPSDVERGEIDPHQFQINHVFKGDLAPFLALNYHSPIKGLSLSAEYWSKDDDANYGYGVSYRPSDLWGVGIYSRDGEEFGFRITLAGNPNNPFSAQDVGDPPIAVVPRHLYGIEKSLDWFANPAIGKAMGTGLVTLVENEGAKLKASEVTATRIALEISPGETLVTPKTIGRITRSLAMNAPGSVENFEITIVNEKDIAVSTTTINRREYEAALEHPNRNELAWKAISLKGAKALRGEDIYRNEEKPDLFDFGGGISLDLFSGDGIRIKPNAHATINPLSGLFLNAYASLNLHEEDTELPETEAATRVRSDKALYRQNIFVLERLNAEYNFKLGNSIYSRARLGLLETQYAGVQGELIYAPPQLPIAFGLDVAELRKRDPETLFGLLEDQARTGFGTLYWDTGFKGIETSLGYGKFIGEDWGSEIRLARKFRNGWRVEGGLILPEKFMDTKNTEYLVSNIAISLPLRWALPIPTRKRANINIGGNSSDFGAKLKNPSPLYNSIRDYDAADYELRWGAFWQ